MESLADLRNRWVHFKVRDVYIPDPQQVLAELYGNDILQGKVLDLTQNRASDQPFVVVKVDGLKEPLIIPLEQILGIL
jgi:hypothetical protein